MSRIQGRPILWMITISVVGFLLMTLLLGTRRGERKAKLSSKDLGTITEITLDESVTDVTLTNVRTLFVIARDDNNSDANVLAKKYCEVANRNGALVEFVRVVKRDRPQDLQEGKPNFVLQGECNCSPIRVK